MTPALSASTAGKNYILASQPNQRCKTPVKSTNSSVMSRKQIAASILLIFRSMILIFKIYLSKLFDSKGTKNLV